MNTSRFSFFPAALLALFALPSLAAPKAGNSPLKDLRVTKLEKKAMLLSYASDTVVGPIKPEDTFRFKLDWVENGRKITVSSGWLFAPANLFDNGRGKDRFRLSKVEQVNRANPRNGVVAKINLATIEDLSPKGRLLELKKGSRNGQILRDCTVTLAFKGKQIVLKEKDKFRLPFGAKKGTQYQFDSVSEKGAVVITWTDGQEKDSLSLPVPQKE